MIKVRAVFPNGGFGFDGQSRRHHGDEFSVEESAFSSIWMEKLEEPEPEEKPKPKRKAAPKKKAPEPEPEPEPEDWE